MSVCVRAHAEAVVVSQCRSLYAIYRPPLGQTRREGPIQEKGTVKVQVPQNARDHGYTWIALDSNNSRLDDLLALRGGGRAGKEPEGVGSDGQMATIVCTHAHTHTHTRTRSLSNIQASRPGDTVGNRAGKGKG